MLNAELMCGVRIIDTTDVESVRMFPFMKDAHSWLLLEGFLETNGIWWHPIKRLRAGVFRSSNPAEIESCLNIINKQSSIWDTLCTKQTYTT